MSGWCWGKGSLEVSLLSLLRLWPPIFWESRSEPDERAWRQEDEVTVSVSLAAGQCQEGGLTMYAILVVRMASQAGHTVPCSWLKQTRIWLAGMVRVQYKYYLLKYKIEKKENG